jgi:sigma-E factor negative regulatory protein RseB
MLERAISLRSWRAVAALAATLAVASAHAASDGAREWITRMNGALRTRNYEGVLTRRIGVTTSDVLKIIHRTPMNERVVVMSGQKAGDESVRNGNESISYYPRQAFVFVETRNRSFGFLTALNGLNEESARYYLISDDGAVKFDGRDAEKIRIEPRDALRYGYRFWLDAKTALPLKTQLVDHAGAVIQELTFVGISFPDTIADERLKPSSFDATRFHWMHRVEPTFMAGLKKVFTPRPELLPAGFQARGFSSPQEEREAQKAGMVRTRFIVSDGVSWVSVFVKPVDQNSALQKNPQGKSPPGVADAKNAANAKGAADAKGNQAGVPPGRPDGVVVMGATATYMARMSDSTNIVVVGDVPPATVKLIAEAVRSD